MDEIERLLDTFDKNISEYKLQMEKYAGNLGGLQRIWQEIADNNSVFRKTVKGLKNESDEGDEEAYRSVLQYAVFCENLGRKLKQAGGVKTAASVITDAIGFFPEDADDLPEDAKDVKEKLIALRNEITRQEAAATERQAAEEEERRRQAEAEEERRRQAEVEEERRRQAEAEEERRRQAEAEEERRRQAEAEEERRRQAEAEEERRRQAEAKEERRRQAEAEEERRRQAEAEEERRRQAEAEEERQRKIAAATKHQNMCSKCGAPNNPGSAFCEECGSRLNPVGQSPVPPKPESIHKEKKSNKMPIIAAIAVLLIAAGGFFAFSGGKGEKKPVPVTNGSSVSEPVKAPKVQEVSVSFVVPDGTNVVWDGKEVSGKNELKVSVGAHEIQLQHPLLEFDYDKKINISNPGQKSLYKGLKKGPNLKAVAEKVNQAMMNDILKQACSSDAVMMKKPIFIENAVVTEELKRAHGGFRSFAVENKVSSFRPVGIVSSELHEPIVGDNGKTTVKSKSVFSVQLTDSDKANYVIETTLAIQGEQVAVSSFDQIRDGE